MDTEIPSRPSGRSSRGQAGTRAASDRRAVRLQESGFGIGARQRLAQQAGAVDVGDHNPLLDQLLPHAGAAVM